MNEQQQEQVLTFKDVAIYRSPEGMGGDQAHAIQPDPWLVPTGIGEGGGSTSRYGSCDPRYETDFEDKLVAAGVPVLFAAGAGERDGEFLERCKGREGVRQ